MQPNKSTFEAARSYIRRISMKSFRKELWFEVPTRRAFINITPQVKQCLQESRIKEGLVLVNTMHI
jgi:thiamine phosphate synthase YjbQ (UPF0047 family)